MVTQIITLVCVYTIRKISCFVIPDDPATVYVYMHVTPASMIFKLTLVGWPY